MRFSNGMSVFAPFYWINVYIPLLLAGGLGFYFYLTISSRIEMCPKGNLEDRRYIRNRSLWRKNGPGRLEVWSGSYKSPVLVETVFPKGVK